MSYDEKNILKSLKKVNDVFNISHDVYFFIQVNKHIYNIQKELKENINFINQNFVDILKKEIQLVKLSVESENNDNKIMVLPQFYNQLINLKEIPKDKSKYAIKIKKILSEYKGIKTITLKIIQEKYKALFNEKISLMTISRVLKNYLGYHYRKTILKNPNLMNYNYLLMGLGFIIGIINSIKSNLDIVFVDETGFDVNNHNLKMWRRDGNINLRGPKNSLYKRINLILAIGKKDIILGHYYKGETIGSNEFITFMDELIEKIGYEKISKTVIVLDNATYHTSKKTKFFCEQKKLKILFNVPYLSHFNAIELAFNVIKSNIYKAIFNTTNQLDEKIEFYLNDEEINNHMEKVYLKTLEEYTKYFEEGLQKLIEYNASGKNFLKKKKKKETK